MARAGIAIAQAAYESGMSIMACVQGHIKVMMHGGGRLEGGLTHSFEKLILDAELLQMRAAFLEPVALDEAALGLDAMADVGPGGLFMFISTAPALFATVIALRMLPARRLIRVYPGRYAPVLKTTQSVCEMEEQELSSIPRSKLSGKHRGPIPTATYRFVPRCSRRYVLPVPVPPCNRRPPRMTTLYIDADACPVKDEVYRVAGRYRLEVTVVANAGGALHRGGRAGAEA